MKSVDVTTAAAGALVAVGLAAGMGRIAPPHGLSLMIKDLVISMGSIELDLFRHDRPQRRISWYSVDSPGEIEFGLHLP
ncbi:MAG: hypothetical protein K0R13_2959 [Propionibacteriaceae bacterium]|nr:hypothetical protein [Propionibacteriaceae bacterium]